MNKNFTLTLLIAAAMIGFSMNSNAQEALASVSTNAEVITPIAISGDTPLEFGSIVATTAGGTVIMGTDGVRGGTADLIVSTSGNLPTAAQFTVTGQADYTYSLTLPTAAYTLSNGATGNMTVDTFTSNETGDLGIGGSETVKVGATLNVGATQEAGTYDNAAGLEVTVQYN